MSDTVRPHLGLVRYDAMVLAIEHARDVDEVKEIRDRARALQVYARQAKDIETQHKVGEIRARAERKAGELLAEMRQTKQRHEGKGRVDKERSGNGTVKLADLDITKNESSQWQQLAAIPTEKFEAALQEPDNYRAVSTDKIIAATKQEAKRAHREAIAVRDADSCTVSDLSLLAGRDFGTIYADPPWLYGNQGTRASTGNHYSGLSIDEICELPVGPTTADEAHLHLWTTNAFLFDAKRVIEAWGFEYKSCYVWVKPQMGIGNYWRVSHEFMLLGVRGNVLFRNRALKSWGEFDRTKHSAKPEAIRKQIESASPGPYLELFGRRVATGWTVWGDQIKRTMFEAEVLEVTG